MNVQIALQQATLLLSDAGIETPRFEAQLLLAWVLKRRREDLARAPEQLLSSREQLIFDKAIELRTRRRPLPYITGEQFFYGRPFKINRAVLIPRPETELLVEAALAMANRRQHPNVADIGTGSGCLAVTLACELPGACVWATDLSPDALTLARKNVERYGAADQVTLCQGDLLTPLPPEVRFDVIVSNPPYITEAEVLDLQPEVRDYEPRLALVGTPGATGLDGTALHRRLLEGARLSLAAQGWLLLEVGQGQAVAVAASARDFGYTAVSVRDDLAGIPRIVMAQQRGEAIV